MAPYRIELLADDGRVETEHHVDCAHDDEAIDHTGSLDHPNAMNLWQEERLVVRFPPWPDPRRPRRFN